MNEAEEIGGETHATVALGPGTAAETVVSTRAVGTTEDSLRTPGDALDLDEVRRTRAFALFAALLAAPFAVFCLVLAHGNYTAKLVHVGSIAVLVVFYLVMAMRLRDPARFAPWNIVALGAFGVLVVATGLYYWGRFAPILLAVPFGLYSFALGRSLAAAVAVAAMCVAVHMTLTVLAVTGVVPDVGLVHPASLTVVEDLSIAAYVWFLLIAVVGMARARRRASQQILGDLDRAVRGIAGREALLDEARLELERALSPGDAGRFTGQVIGGYTLGAVLGRGAIGEVYDGVNADGAHAAVKLLRRSVLGESQHVRRFFRELEIAAALETPHVVDVLAVSTTDDAIPFLAMERLVGETLGEYLRSHRRMDEHEVAAMLDEVCAGVGAAHAAGIVHRDLKPRNLFRHQSGALVVWKVLDFGVSKMAGGEALTHGGVVGTPNYMSPEQAAGGEVDARADIFGLGAILYRCLTGQPAFSGRDIPSVLYAVTHAMPAQPSKMARLPPAIDAVIAVALAKAPGDRFASAAELATAFRDATCGRLDPAIEERAAELLADRPWGSQHALR